MYPKFLSRTKTLCLFDSITCWVSHEKLSKDKYPEAMDRTTYLNIRERREKESLEQWWRVTRRRGWEVGSQDKDDGPALRGYG